MIDVSVETSVDYQQIGYALDEGLLTITLNRPEQLNAFTPQMAAELIDAFERASREDAVRAVIVTGAGKAFCAGMDLRRKAMYSGWTSPSRRRLQICTIALTIPPSSTVCATPAAASRSRSLNARNLSSAPSMAPQSASGRQ